jgi:hypothetical protein
MISFKGPEGLAAPATGGRRQADMVGLEKNQQLIEEDPSGFATAVAPPPW